jgi:carboxymethylenebutenolidase
MPHVKLSGGLPAHLTIPPVGPGPWPGVVVIHEVFGVNDDIREQVGRLAAAGYLALAPDLYRGLGKRRCLLATFKALFKGEGQAFDDIEAARAELAGRADCTGRVGVLGFCMGGGFALLAASRGFDAAAPNYGPLPKDLDLSGSCPMVASYGGRDWENPGAAGKVEAALTRAGVVHDVKEYPGAGHSFMGRPNSDPFLRVARIGYHAPSAEDAWGRILRFFDEHLRGPRPGSSPPGTTPPDGA